MTNRDQYDSKYFFVTHFDEFDFLLPNTPVRPPPIFVRTHERLYSDGAVYLSA